jgi:hypothetical protein
VQTLPACQRKRPVRGRCAYVHAIKDLIFWHCAPAQPTTNSHRTPHPLRSLAPCNATLCRRCHCSVNPTTHAATPETSIRTLRLWNLLEGRAAYIKRLPGGGDAVRWSPTGARFAVVVAAQLLVYDAGGSEPRATLLHPLKVRVPFCCEYGKNY